MVQHPKSFGWSTISDLHSHSSVRTRNSVVAQFWPQSVRSTNRGTVQRSRMSLPEGESIHCVGIERDEPTKDRPSPWPSRHQRQRRRIVEAMSHVLSARTICSPVWLAPLALGLDLVRETHITHMSTFTPTSKPPPWLI